VTSLVLTITETLRYRGAIGQWSWVLHRVTGLGVVFFLILHVIDTSWAVFYPAEYVRAIAEYQSPLFTIGEFALVAAVVYHALNGLRIIIFDYRPEWWKYQQTAAWWVLGGAVVLLIPVFLLMFSHVSEFYFGATPPTVLPLLDVVLAQMRFVAGIGAAVILALILSVLYGMIAGTSEKKQRSPSQIERFWWRYMRISGLLIIPLVFGHLALMHIIQGVFDIQFNAELSSHFAVGAVGDVIGMNTTGTAVEFVHDRWNTLVAGVAIWRLYDIALLALAVTHGFNGLRYVFTDYTPNSTLRRAATYLCIIAAVVLLAIGGAALLVGVDQTAVDMAQQALANLHQ
jgi:succinate dehydrogenase / fumarate reductase cytochrome b subunit